MLEIVAPKSGRVRCGAWLKAVRAANEREVGLYFVGPRRTTFVAA